MTRCALRVQNDNPLNGSGNGNRGRGDIVGVAYVLSLQGSVLLETRRHTKELQAQRELADKAEASRFTELGTAMRAEFG